MKNEVEIIQMVFVHITAYNPIALLFYCPRHRASTFAIRVYDICKVWINITKKMPEKDFPNKPVTGFQNLSM